MKRLILLLMILGLALTGCYQHPHYVYYLKWNNQMYGYSGGTSVDDIHLGGKLGTTSGYVVNHGKEMNGDIGGETFKYSHSVPAPPFGGVMTVYKLLNKPGDLVLVDIRNNEKTIFVFQLIR